MPNNIAYQTTISTKAQNEIEYAWAWYEDRQIGLGDRFVKEVIQQLRQIELYPDRYAIKHKTYRETGVPIFPYLVIYKVNKRKRLVYVLSIFHGSRNPKKKYG